MTHIHGGGLAGSIVTKQWGDMPFVEGDIKVFNSHLVAIEFGETMEGNSHWEMREGLASLRWKSTLSCEEYLTREKVNMQIKLKRSRKEDWGDKHKCKVGSHTAYGYLLYYIYISIIIHLNAYLCNTFSFVVKEYRVISLHDVSEEESSAYFTLWPEAATQISPEGSFEGEVPWGRDAILSWKFNNQTHLTYIKNTS